MGRLLQCQRKNTQPLIFCGVLASCQFAAKLRMRKGITYAAAFAFDMAAAMFWGGAVVIKEKQGFTFTASALWAHLIRATIPTSERLALLRSYRALLAWPYFLPDSRACHSLAIAGGTVPHCASPLGQNNKQCPKIRYLHNAA